MIFERRMSIGNVLVIAGMLTGFAAQWYGLTQQVALMKKDTDALQYRIEKLEGSNAVLDSLRQSSARLVYQVDELVKVVDRLDRRLDRQERGGTLRPPSGEPVRP